jgi:oligopeptide transport system ATP-binding protein
MSLLLVENLSVAFKTNDGQVNAVNDVSFSINKGESLAIVGESGSGKSQTVFALMGLLARNGLATGRAVLDGQDILNLPAHKLGKIRAQKMAMIFQDPMTSLNPYMRVSDQLAEVLVHHKGMSKSAAVKEAIHMLDAVRIPEAAKRIQMFPHEFSGGMRQRVMIAMSLLCKPDLLIADEPTTALDVTVQDQIMDLLKSLQIEFNMAMLLITHDLGVVANSCDDMLVLYGGQVMEQGRTADLFADPAHPYTMGLLSAVPRLDQSTDRLVAIPGNPPNMMSRPKGCPFAPRCTFAEPVCVSTKPQLETSPKRKRACHLTKDALS